MSNLHESLLAMIECLGTLEGYENILLPMKPTYDYDFLVEYAGKFVRVKVIHTNRKSPTGSYVANLRKSGGYSPTNTHKAPFDNTRLDYLYISAPDAKYWIPAKDIQNINALSLNSYVKYIIPE